MLVETVLGDAAARSRGSGCSTSTPASGSSPRSSPTRSGAGRVVAVEGPARRREHAAANLPVRVQVRARPVDRVLAAAYDEPFDLVVLDPPREGARGQVVEQIADRAPRAVAYVACDPAALARDLATFAELGYSLASCAPSTCSR